MVTDRHTNLMFAKKVEEGLVSENTGFTSYIINVDEAPPIVYTYLL